MTQETPITTRLGVVGAGAMGARIAASAAASGRFEIAAVVDVDASRRSGLAKELGAASYPDMESMFAESVVDAVYLGLPPTLNRPACEAARAADVHVMVDKPLATTADDGRIIAELAARSTRAWVVGFSYRFRSEWARAREVLASGRLGEVRSVTDVIIEASTGTPSWYWSPDLGGGVINLQSHHCFDRIGWLVGSDVVGVVASTWRLPSGSDPSGHILARYDSGTTAVISLGFGLTYDDEPRTLFVAQCDAGMLQIDAARNLRITDGEGTVVESHGDDDWLTTEVTAFADAIADPASASPNITDGYRALRSALAAEQSTQDGRWVVPDR